MAVPRFDAIVVGARVAGAATTAFLALAGCGVLLLDRAIFPKPTISCPLYFANTQDSLRRLGAGHLIERLGAPRLTRYELEIDGVPIRGRMLPYNGIEGTYSIRREHFDKAFFTHVAALPNVDARLGVSADALIWEQERVVGVRGRGRDGKPFEARADLVVGADGVFSTVAEQAGAPKYQTLPPRTCVWYAYYANATEPGGTPAARIHYDTTERFALITADSDAELTVISLTLPAERYAHAAAHAESLHAEYARRVPRLAERLARAERVTPLYRLAPRESFYRVPYGRGWSLVGDAAFYKDPLPGQGIHDALWSAERAAEAFAQFQANGATEQAWHNAFDAYRRERDETTRAMYRFTDFYADLASARAPHIRWLIRALADMPDWAERFVSIFDGVTDVGEFSRYSNIARVIATLRWRQISRRLTRKSVPEPAPLARMEDRD